MKCGACGWHHRTSLSGCIFAAEACIDNRKKNLLNIDTSSTCLHNMVNFGILTVEIRWGNLQISTTSRLGSVTAWPSSSGRQPNFAALNRGRHLYLAGRPSRWALAHILVVFSSFPYYSRPYLAEDCYILVLLFITFRASRRRREMYIGHARLSHCVSAYVCVCLSVPRRIPTLLYGVGCNSGNGRGAPSCAVSGGSEIGARVSLL